MTSKGTLKSNPSIAVVTTLVLESIEVGERSRQHAGDIDSLAASIDEVGLLHPIVVTPEGELVAGWRRLQALKLLDWALVPVTIVDNLTTAEIQLKAGSDENTCRENLSPSEALIMRDRLLALEKPAAKARQREAGTRYGKGRPKSTVQLARSSEPEHARRSKDRASKATGYSRRTLDLVEAIVEAAVAEPERFGPLVAEMDRTGRVSGVHRKLAIAKKAEVIAAEPPVLPTGRFRVIVADPPWRYDRGAKDATHRGATPYPTMTTAEVCALPVADIADEDAVLWLWTTNSHLPDAFDVVKAWGFSYKTTLTWGKDRIGTGTWLRGQTEHCLLAVRGKPTLLLSNQSTLLRAPRGKHSAKPAAFFDLVERLCPGSKVELFCRTPRDGWAAFGDEVRVSA
jgi:ParB/RepB/Spo0J family partition protein